MMKHRKWSVALHGGCTNTCPSPGRQLEIKGMLQGVTETAAKALECGSTAKDVAARVVQELEDSYLFNAGHGSSFNGHGRHEVCYHLASPTNYLFAEIFSLRLV